LTYPRTDSRYISDDIVETLKDRVKACSVGPYAKIGFKISSLAHKGEQKVLLTIPRFRTTTP